MTDTQTLYPALATITPDDQRGVFWIIAIICVAFVYLTFAVRVFVRWQRFQPDDYAICAACVLVLAQASVLFAAVGMGLGASGLILERQHEIRMVWRLFIASEALFVIALFAAKTAVLLTIEKLPAADMKVRLLFKYTLGVVGLLGLASVLAVTVGCGSDSLLTQGDGRCMQQTRWIAVAVIDAVTEIWAFSLFCSVVWSLHMKAALKITSTALIGLRLFCIAFAGVHAYYASVLERSTDPAVAIIQPLTWQQLALTYSLLSAMAVALRPFLRDFHTGMGMGMSHVTDGSRYGRGSNAHAYPGLKLDDLSKSRDKDSRLAQGDSNRRDEDERYRPDDIHYSAAIYHADRKPSHGSLHSQQPMIRHEVEYNVVYDTA